jgi:hypothetical protein
LTQLLQRQRQAATGSQEQARAFSDLGIETRDAEGNLRTLDQILPDLADSIQGAREGERAGIAMRFFGEQGRRLVPMLAQGRAGIEAMRRELEELGGGASEEMIQQAVQMQDDLSRLRLSWVSLRSTLAVRILPTLDRLVKWGTSASVWLGGVVRHSKILEAALIGLGAVAVGVAIYTAPTWLPVALAIMGVVAAVLILDSVLVGLDGGKSFIRDMLDDLGELVGYVNAGTEAFYALQAAIDMVAQSAMVALNFVRGLAGMGAIVSGDAQEQAQQEGAATGGRWARGGLVATLAGGVINPMGAFGSMITGGAGAGLLDTLRRGGATTPENAEQARRERAARNTSLDQYYSMPAANPMLWSPSRPAQVPTITPSSFSGGAAGFSQPVVTPVRPSISQVVNAPARLNLVVNAATDAQETARIASARVREEFEVQARRIQALLPGGGEEAAN